jgi:hypothetical protein
MSTETTNYHFIKPGDTDPVDNTPLNQNFDSIDAAIADHVADTNNPHQTTKEQVGLGNVDNTSDADKPISTAVQAALDSKQTSLTTDQLAAVNSGITAADVTQMRTNSIKLVYRRILGQNSGTVSYRMATADFTAVDNAQQCGMYLITIINWSATPTASVYIAYYSGGTTSYNALTKIGGVDAQLSIDENRYINYTGNGKIQIYALQ